MPAVVCVQAGVQVLSPGHVSQQGVRTTGGRQLCLGWGGGAWRRRRLHPETFSAAQTALHRQQGGILIFLFSFFLLFQGLASVVHWINFIRIPLWSTLCATAERGGREQRVSAAEHCCPVWPMGPGMSGPDGRQDPEWLKSFALLVAPSWCWDVQPQSPVWAATKPQSERRNWDPIFPLFIYKNSK